MIGIKFLVRALLFLIIAGIVSAGIVLIWYYTTKAIMWIVDCIEQSNSDFMIWLKSKLRTLKRK